MGKKSGEKERSWKRNHESKERVLGEDSRTEERVYLRGQSN